MSMSFVLGFVTGVNFTIVTAAILLYLWTRNF
jgi:hypothetical protein